MTAAYDLPADPTALARLASRATGRPVRAGRVIETGFDHRVLLAGIDDTPWVFRFPRRPDVLPDLARERGILSLLRAADLGIPVPAWVVDTAVDDLPVVGYRAVPGEPAGEEPRSDGDFVLAIDLPLRESFVDKLGRALAAVHAIPADQVAAELGPETADRRSIRAQHLAVVRGTLALPTALEQRWRSQLDEDRWWPVPSCLVHGDVHPGHTLVDGEGDLTGLLDWTDGGWGDPAIDFVDTLHCYGRATTDRLVDAYRSAGGSVDGLPERIEVLAGFGVLKAAHDAILADRPDILDRARRRMVSRAG